MKASLFFLCVGIGISVLQCARAEIGGPDSAFFLMEIDILPNKKPCDTVHLVANAMKATDGVLVWLFKVLGEGRILAITQYTPEPFWKAITDAAGEDITVVTTPLKPYEHFAVTVNNVDPIVANTPHGNLEPRENERTYFVDAIIGYKGYSNDEFRRVWPLESIAMLTDRAAGNLQMEFWKAIGDNRVPLFMTYQPDHLDDLAFAVPLVTELGDNQKFLMKEVVSLL